MKKKMGTGGLGDRGGPSAQSKGPQLSARPKTQTQLIVYGNTVYGAVLLKRFLLRACGVFIAYYKP